MQYEPQSFDNLLGLEGFSDEALKTHFGLYEGYVKNTNATLQKLESLEKNSPEYNELKRRFGWEFNGMRLHEYHFESMAKDAKALDTDSKLMKQIEKDFGSFENWAEDFKATAKTRGIGWAILYYDEKGERLFNVFVNEHDLGHLSGNKLILNLDVFEHAFLIDYKTDRGSYIDAFMNAIDWNKVSNRI